MAGFQDVHSVYVPVLIPGSGGGTILAGTFNYPALRAPSDANGGGITIVSAQSFSGTAGDGAGSALKVTLHRYSSTYVLEGTIASAAPAAGSAWPAGTPSAYTISDEYVDASEYVVVNVIATAVSASVNERGVLIQYMMGQ